MAVCIKIKQVAIRAVNLQGSLSNYSGRFSETAVASQNYQPLKLIMTHANLWLFHIWATGI